MSNNEMYTDGINLYLDLSYVNLDPNQKHLSFLQSRDIPFLEDPSKYYFLISKFQVNINNSLPIWIPKIQTLQPDPNLTVYTFKIVFTDGAGTHEHEETMMYEPTDTTSSVRPPIVEQDLSSDYYYVKTYTWFAYMVNKTLKKISDAIKTAYPAYPYADYPPFLTFNSSTGLFNLYHPEIASTENFQLFTNDELMILINSFPYKFISTTEYLNIEIMLLNKISLNDKVTGYNHITQDQTTLASFNPIRSLAFTSNLLPITQTMISPAIVEGQNTPNKANIANIINDYTVDVNVGSTYNQTLTYVASGEFKFLDMKTHNPLYHIDISMYWVDSRGNFYPVQLFRPSFATLTIMFRRKDFNNINLIK